jgi:hypothetical protein
MIFIVLGQCYEPHERLQWRKLQRNTLQPPVECGSQVIQQSEPNICFVRA